MMEVDSSWSIENFAMSLGIVVGIVVFKVGKSKKWLNTKTRNINKEAGENGKSISQVHEANSSKGTSKPKFHNIL